jgi:hypothetical protein
MNCANVVIEVEVRDVDGGQDDVSALSVEQLQLIAGGECVVNSI